MFSGDHNLDISSVQQEVSCIHGKKLIKTTVGDLIPPFNLDKDQKDHVTVQLKNVAGITVVLLKLL